MPVERKRMLGNPGHQKLPAVHTTAAIAPAVDPPKPARHLPAGGMRVWRRLWKFGAAWLSQGTDLEIMTRLVEAYGERDELRDLIDEHGRTTRGSTGQLVTSPYVAQLSDVDKRILRMEQACGFTPADRSRMGLAEVRAASSLDKLAAERDRRREEREKQRQGEHNASDQ